MAILYRPTEAQSAAIRERLVYLPAADIARVLGVHAHHVESASRDEHVGQAAAWAIATNLHRLGELPMREPFDPDKLGQDLRYAHGEAEMAVFRAKQAKMTEGTPLPDGAEKACSLGLWGGSAETVLGLVKKLASDAQLTVSDFNRHDFAYELAHDSELDASARTVAAEAIAEALRSRGWRANARDRRGPTP